MDEMLNSYNPADGILIGSVGVTPLSAIDSIVEKGSAAQKEWAALSVDNRIETLVKAGQALERKSKQIGELLCKEMGKGLRSGIGEVSGSGRSVAHVADQVKSAIAPAIMRGYGGQTSVEYHPLGVCGIISPWNYPVSMAHWMMIPALTAGNAVVLKPSEETPLVAQAYVDALNEALPKDLLQIIHGDERQGRALVKSKVDFIGFTGSKEAGQDIMRVAAQTLKPLIMELGGKDPLIVLSDADIDAAAQFAVANSLENAGQMCISTERIFVDSKIAPAFEQKVIEYVCHFKTGPYTDPNARIGPIINDRQRQRILRHIEDAERKGARVLAGGENHPPRFIAPTVLSGITDDMDIAKEETFGPVICITQFADIEAAINSANGTEYGLSAVVFGKAHAREVADRLEAGMVGINTGAGGGGDTPWVGAKQSGFGYHGSPGGHRQFTQVRVVSEVSV